MDRPPGTSLYCYLKQTKMLSFSFTKLGLRRAEQLLSVGSSGWGQEIKEGCRRVKVVEIFCTHV
jgi:hypothetical protein